jgi:hypothetical protein
MTTSKFSPTTNTSFSQDTRNDGALVNSALNGSFLDCYCHYAEFLDCLFLAEFRRSKSDRVCIGIGAVFKSKNLLGFRSESVVDFIGIRNEQYKIFRFLWPPIL